VGEALLLKKGAPRRRREEVGGVNDYVDDGVGGAAALARAGVIW